MNPLKNLPLVYAVAALLFTLIAVAATAQTQVEGSRPGQTYRIGETAPQQPQAPNAAPAQPYGGQSATPQMQQPAYGQPVNPAGAPATSVAQPVPSGKPVIMEFSDLQCPDSARFNTGLKGSIMQRYVGEGKAEYQWRDFPLPSHAEAPEAAAAARCAGSSADRMRQMIMSNQGQMSTNAYIQYARQLNLDADKFTACLRNGTTMREVQNDRAMGQSYGVRGTPSLVLATSDGRGNVQPVKVIKAYDPPQQVMSEIDAFMQQSVSTSANAPGRQ